MTEQLLTLSNATREQPVNALLWAGAAPRLMGDTPQACGYFRETLMLSPQIELNQGAFPKALISLFNQTKAGYR